MDSIERNILTEQLDKALELGMEQILSVEGWNDFYSDENLKGFTKPGVEAGSVGKIIAKIPKPYRESFERFTSNWEYFQEKLSKNIAKSEILKDSEGIALRKEVIQFGEGTIDMYHVYQARDLNRKLVEIATAAFLESLPEERPFKLIFLVVDFEDDGNGGTDVKVVFEMALPEFATEQMINGAITMRCVFYSNIIHFLSS